MGLGRGLAVGATAAVAAVAGTVAAFVHRSTLEVGEVALPVGLAAALGGAGAAVLVARAVGRTRVAVLLVGAAFAVPVLVLSQLRPEGDLVVAGDVWGLTLLGGVSLVVTLGVVVPVSAYHGPDASSDPARVPTTPVVSNPP